jgi:hypothetical protein
MSWDHHAFAMSGGGDRVVLKQLQLGRGSAPQTAVVSSFQSSNYAMSSLSDLRRRRKCALTVFPSVPFLISKRARPSRLQWVMVPKEARASESTATMILTII